MCFISINKNNTLCIPFTLSDYLHSNMLNLKYVYFYSSRNLKGINLLDFYFIHCKFETVFHYIHNRTTLHWQANTIMYICLCLCCADWGLPGQVNSLASRALILIAILWTLSRSCLEVSIVRVKRECQQVIIQVREVDEWECVFRV